MIHIKRGESKRAKHKKVLKLTKKFTNDSSTKYKTASLKLLKALKHSKIHTYLKKRNFKKTIIKSINNYLNTLNIKYSTFINKIKVNDIKLNNHMIYILLSNEPLTFYALFNSINIKHVKN